MALKSFFDKLDDIPEALRGEYVEKGGKFVLDVEGVDDITNLTTALANERKTKKELEKQVEGWKKLGKTEAEITELLAKQAQQEEERVRKEGDFDKLLKQHQETWAKEKTTLETMLTAAQASERSAIIDNSLVTALTKAGVTEEGLVLLPRQLSDRVKLELKDGKRLINIVQEDGATPLAGKGENGTATFDDLAAEAAKKFPSLFKSEDGGSGRENNSPPSNKKGAKTMTRAEFNKKNPAERMQLMQKGEVTIVD